MLPKALKTQIVTRSCNCTIEKITMFRQSKKKKKITLKYPPIFKKKKSKDTIKMLLETKYISCQFDICLTSWQMHYGDTDR